MIGREIETESVIEKETGIEREKEMTGIAGLAGKHVNINYSVSNG